MRVALVRPIHCAGARFSARRVISLCPAQGCRNRGLRAIPQFHDHVLAADPGGSLRVPRHQDRGRLAAWRPSGATPFEATGEQTIAYRMSFTLLSPFHAESQQVESRRMVAGVEHLCWRRARKEHCLLTEMFCMSCHWSVEAGKIVAVCKCLLCACILYLAEWSESCQMEMCHERFELFAEQVSTSIHKHKSDYRVKLL